MASNDEQPVPKYTHTAQQEFLAQHFMSRVALRFKMDLNFETSAGHLHPENKGRHYIALDHSFIAWLDEFPLNTKQQAKVLETLNRLERMNKTVKSSGLFE